MAQNLWLSHWKGMYINNSSINSITNDIIESQKLVERNMQQQLDAYNIFVHFICDLRRRKLHFKCNAFVLIVAFCHRWFAVCQTSSAMHTTKKKVYEGKWRRMESNANFVTIEIECQQRNMGKWHAPFAIDTHTHSLLPSLLSSKKRARAF